jgi:Flp pilus assembly protein TadD
MTRRLVVLTALCAVVAAAPPLAAAPRHREDGLAAVARLIHEWRIEEAAAALQPLQKARPDDPEVALLHGELQFLQGDYETAVTTLQKALPALRGSPGELGEARGLYDLAAATAEVTRGFVEERSPGGHFIIRYRRGREAVLAPYAGEALEKARAALGADFAGISPGDAALPATPVRVEIYDEIADLSRVSTLTLREIETSGTIALCKWNRLMIVSPKALVRGYPWLDTLTHEYTHYIVSRVARNMVPIWLHEGLAKFEERRWRGPAGGGLSPTMEQLLATALSKKHFITFEQMSPSMAKLPSQEDTALAFAEVYTVVEFLHGKLGWQGVRALLADMASGTPDLRALAAAYGGSFAAFDKAWKSWLRGRKLKARSGLFADKLQFKKAPPGAAGAKKNAGSGDEDDSGEVADPRARNFVRLGGMLRARGRLLPAAMEYEKAQGLLGTSHPLLALKLARTYLDLGDADRAIAAIEPARELYADLAGLNAALGAAWLRKGELAKAAPYLEAAIATSPFDPSVHCGLATAYARLGEPQAAREQSACALLSGK